MIGRVVIEAARVKSRYSVTGLVRRSKVGVGKRRAAKATKARENGSAYRIKPSVAKKESWKPGSQSSCGLKAAMTAATRVRLSKPNWRRPSWLAKSDSPPIKAARTTLGLAPTRRVYKAIPNTARAAPL